MERTKVIIGVDGGGSKSAGAAVGMDGNVLALFRGKGINYYAIGMERARQNLLEIVNALLEQCGGTCELLSVGMPALDTTADEETLRAFAGNVFDPRAMIMESDARMALEGMTGGDRGMIVICGTGSMAVLMDENGEKAAGGWGFLLGDPGSGCGIAMAGLRASIRAWEGTGPETGLSERALAFFRLAAPRDLIPLIYDPACGPDAVARFAGEVFALAEEGDGEALQIIREETRLVAWQAASLLQSAPEVEKVGLYGGIFQHQPLARKLFADALRARLPGHTIQIVEPEFPPEIGAVIRGFKRLGTLNAERLVNLKMIKKEVV
jgi:N-acetylglucosamine kinase-like BadF-type ATPase